MKTKQLIFALAATSLFIQTAKPLELHAKTTPNVLFIAIDDMNDWTTLFDESNPIQTPNLKRLARRGAFFSKAYCAVPACNPSRTAILTGLSPVTSGVYGNGQSWKQLLPDVVTLPQYFGHHGFTTKGGGKIFHHGGTGTDRKDNPSFDEFFKLQIHSGKPDSNYNGYERGGRKTGPLGSPGWDWGVHDVDKQTDEYTVEYVSQAQTHKNRATSYLGKSFINTYLDGDRKTGELISPPFRIERKHINFLIGGGNHPGRAGIQLRVDDKTVRSATGRAIKNPANQEIMDWQSLDVAEFIGKQAVLKIVDKHSGGWGHTVVDHIFQSDKPMPSSLPANLKVAKSAPSPQAPEPSPLKPGQFDPAHRTFATYSDVGYDQKLRPQFHFSSRKNWINDPNGMVYYDGEWHLYFQHCALSVNRGPKSWGHAVSKDMVHWEQLPHAILPYDKGAIWSGTAVVDHNNSLRKQVGETKTLVAFFTTTWKDGFYQAMAYSTDRGRTYTLHNNGEAVVPNQGFSKGERDPKVFWDERRQKWKMVLILGGKERVIRIFESDNLTDWVKAGDINRNWAAECIDLFQLPVDGDRNDMKWVIADASFDYEVGQFTGNGFETEGPTGRGDYGKGFYAAQTFNNGPDGRVVQIGWMNDRRQVCPYLVEAMPFNQQLAFPTDLSLRTTPDGIRLFRWPVPEINSLYAKPHSYQDITAEAATKALAKVKPELVDLSIEFEPSDTGRLDLTVRGITISYGDNVSYRNADKKAIELKSFTFNGKSCPAPSMNGKVRLRVLADRTSIELYANDGATVASSYDFESPKDYSLTVSTQGPVKINSLVVNELKSSWLAR